MKRLLLLVAAILVVSVARADTKSYRLILQDYSYDDADVRPFSLGMCTWTDKEKDLTVGGYFNVALLTTLQDRMRLGFGMGATAGDEQSPVKMRFQSSLTTRIFDCVEVGVWMAPFWGLTQNDDPYGLMVGYAFRF